MSFLYPQHKHNAALPMLLPGITPPLSRALLDGLPVALFRIALSEEAGPAYLNPACYTLLGLSKHEPLQKNSYDLDFWKKYLHPQDFPKLISSWHELLHTCHHQARYQLLLERGFQEVEVRLCLQEDAQGQWIEGTLIPQEVAALREASYFQFLADSLPAKVWLIDAHQQVRYTNRGWQEFTGQTLSQSLAQAWTEALHPDDRLACEPIFEKAFASQQPFSLEFRLRKYDGSYCWMLGRGSPLICPQRGFEGYIGTGLDISALKQLSLDLALHNKALEHISYLQSHVLRKPVASILGLVSILDSSTLCAENAFIFSKLTACTRELDAVIHDIIAQTHLSLSPTDPEKP